MLRFPFGDVHAISQQQVRHKRHEAGRYLTACNQKSASSGKSLDLILRQGEYVRKVLQLFEVFDEYFGLALVVVQSFALHRKQAHQGFHKPLFQKPVRGLGG